MENQKKDAILKMQLATIDHAIKYVWEKNIKQDYIDFSLLREASLKCSFYYHLRRKLASFLKENDLRIFPEYYFDQLGYHADLAICRVDRFREEPFLDNMITEVLVVIELKYTNGNSKSAEEWVKSDIIKLKKYIQSKIHCQYYFGVIYENECKANSWLEDDVDHQWAKGFVIELNASYNKGKMEFTCNDQ